MYRSLAELQEANRGCKLCTLRKRCDQIIPGKGNGVSKLLIVLDPPGPPEDADNKLVTGKSLRVFQQILKFAGLSKDDFYVTPIVKCASYQKEGRYKKSIPHKKHEVESCKRWIWEELKLLQPKVIITMGGLATKTLLDLDAAIPLKSIIGEELRAGYTEAVFIPTYSPSYLVNIAEWHTKRTGEIFKKAKELL